MLDTGANIDAVGAPQRLAFMEHAGLDFPIKRLAAEVSTVGGQTAVICEATARVPSTSPDVYAEAIFKVLSSTSLDSWPAYKEYNGMDSVHEDVHRRFRERPNTPSCHK